MLAVEQSGALFAIALNDREYMLRATSKEDAELWVKKLNILKANPTGGSGTEGAKGAAAGAAASAGTGAGGAGGGGGGGGGALPSGHPTAEELTAATAGGQTDPNTWAKSGKMGCC